MAPTAEAAVEVPRAAEPPVPAPAPAQAPPPSAPQEEPPPAKVVALQPAPAADAEPLVSQEPVASPAAFEEAETALTSLGDAETVPAAFQEAETALTSLGEAETVPAAFQEAETVEARSAELLAPEHDPETEADPDAAGLPIHLWVQAPGANGTEADPAWPQELVRLELERTLRARDRDRPRDD